MTKDHASTIRNRSPFLKLVHTSGMTAKDCNSPMAEDGKDLVNESTRMMSSRGVRPRMDIGCSSIMNAPGLLRRRIILGVGKLIGRQMERSTAAQEMGVRSSTEVKKKKRKRKSIDNTCSNSRSEVSFARRWNGRCCSTVSD